MSSSSTKSLFKLLSRTTAVLLCWAVIISTQSKYTPWELPAAYAQTATATLSGTVLDETGAVLPDVNITVASAATGLKRQARTNSDGLYAVSLLPPGTYVVTAQREGFTAVEVSDVVLNIGDQQALKIELKVGPVGETVTVSADTAQLQIQSESGERSDLITNKQIKDLALNGRNLLDLMKVVPGVVSTVNAQVSNPSNQLGEFNINGTRNRQHELTIDGSSNVTTSSNASQHVTINPDAVAEVRILTSNYQAEYGKAGGGFIQFVTKSGTNEFHGTGRYFRRHDSLNANNFFRNAEGRNLEGSEQLPRPLYRYDYFGYDIGGPIYIPGFFNEKKDRLFFFFSQEYYQQLIPQAARNLRVPTEAERNGDFSNTRDGNGGQVFIRDPNITATNAVRCEATPANPVAGVNYQAACFRTNGVLNVIPRERFYSNGQAILGLYPGPNFPGENRFNYTSSFSNEYPRREDILRLDAQLTDRTRLSARVINNADEQLNYYGGVFFSGINFPLTRFNSSRPGLNGALTVFHSFTPTLTNEFIFGPSRTILTIEADDENVTRAANGINVPLLFQDANPADYIPNFTYGGVQNQTFPNTNFMGVPYKTINSSFNFIDNVTKVLAKHTIKAGIYVQHSRADAPATGPNNATVDFTSGANNPLNTGHPYANALLGIYNTYRQTSNLPLGLFRYTNTEFYVQDTWKVHPRLTLDYGVRFSYYQPQYDERLQTGVFEPSLFDRSQAVRLYEPICAGAAPCPSGSSLRAVDPANRPAAPTQTNTLPSALIGLIVPNSGNLANGIGRAGEGYPRGGFEDRGLLFGPRFGFAYDVFGNAKTVVRGGFGVSYSNLHLHWHCWYATAFSMKAYSADLRQKIVSAYEQGEGTLNEIADSCSIARRRVARYLNLHHERESLQPKPRGGGVPFSLKETPLKVLQKCVAEQNAITLDELVSH